MDGEREGGVNTRWSFCVTCLLMSCSMSLNLVDSRDGAQVSCLAHSKGADDRLHLRGWGGKKPFHLL